MLAAHSILPTPMQKNRAVPNTQPNVRKIEAEDTAEYAVIWLHGLGATNEDFLPIIPHLNVTKKQNIRFVLPQAPMRSITINNGMSMPGWYDIYGLDRTAKQDEEGIRESEQAIIDLIEEEAKSGIAYQNIFLAGFSQGGAVVLHTALRFPHRLGGIIALSTYLPLDEQLSNEKHAANSDIPIFLAHGTSDMVLPFYYAEYTQQVLSQHDYDVDFHRYDMGHTVSLEEIQDIDAWLSAEMASNKSITVAIEDAKI